MRARKKIYKSSIKVSGPVRPKRVDGGVRIPEDEKQHLVAAAAYFRAARHRQLAAGECRKDDECAAAAELDAVLKRHDARH